MKNYIAKIPVAYVPLVVPAALVIISVLANVLGQNAEWPFQVFWFALAVFVVEIVYLTLKGELV